MLMNHVGVVAVAIWFVLVPSLAVAEEGGRAAAEDPVVAIVDDTDIYRSELEFMRGSLPEQYQSYPVDVLFPLLLDQAIDSKLIAQEGRKRNIQDDEAVKRQVAFIEDRIIHEIFLRRYMEEVVTEEMLDAHYQEFLKLNPPDEQVRARHILLESEDEAKAVIAEISDGADFVEAAKAQSTGPSAAQGGDIGYFGRGDVVPEFAEAAFGLEPGEITQSPVKSQFGWHVIKVEDRRLADPPSLEDTRDQLVSEISRDLVATLLERLRGEATIKRFRFDGSPSEGASSEAEGGSSAGDAEAAD